MLHKRRDVTNNVNMNKGLTYWGVIGPSWKSNISKWSNKDQLTHNLTEAYGHLTHTVSVGLPGAPNHLIFELLVLVLVKLRR